MYNLKTYPALGLAVMLSLNSNLLYAACNCTSSYAGQYQVVTNNLPLGFRSEHSSTSTKIGTLPKGAIINVTAGNGTWAHVTYNGINGYASMQYLRKVASSSQNTSTNSASSSLQPSVVLTTPNSGMQNVSLGAANDTCYCSTAYAGKYKITTQNSNLRLRSKHSTDSSSQILANMPKGAIVEVTAMGNGWAHVTYNGKNGYASSEYLTRCEEAAPSNVLKGDVNGDGKVDLTDLSQLKLYRAKIQTTLARMDNADINGDGKVDLVDLTRLQLHISGIEPFDSNGQPISQSSDTHSSRPTPQQYTVVYPESGLLYSIQPKCAPNNELTVYGASKNSGTKVVSHDKNSHWHTELSHQKWYVTRVGNTEWYKIQAENSKLALSADNLRAGYLADAAIRDYVGADQQFKFVVQADEPNYYKIVANKGSANNNQYVLSVVNSSNGRIEQPIRIEPNNPVASGQFWKMEVRKPGLEYVWPIDCYNITTLYYYNGAQYSSQQYRHGCRYDLHNALDIYANANTPVRAAHDGTVGQFQKLPSGFGNYIVLTNQETGDESLYAHLNSYATNNHVKVKKGDIIGYSGKSGITGTGGYHLHFEMKNRNIWEYFRDKVSFTYNISTMATYIDHNIPRSDPKLRDALLWIDENHYRKSYDGCDYCINRSNKKYSDFR